MPTPDLSSRQQQPDVRPLGLIAFGLAVLALVLAPTYFLSLLAFLAAVPAAALGLISRADPVTRRLGNLALVITCAAVICATVVLVSS